MSRERLILQRLYCLTPCYVTAKGEFAITGPLPCSTPGKHSSAKCTPSGPWQPGHSSHRTAMRGWPFAVDSPKPPPRVAPPRHGRASRPRIPFGTHGYFSRRMVIHRVQLNLNRAKHLKLINFRQERGQFLRNMDEIGLQHIRNNEGLYRLVHRKNYRIKPD